MQSQNGKVCNMGMKTDDDAAASVSMTGESPSVANVENVKPAVMRARSGR